MFADLWELRAEKLSSFHPSSPPSWISPSDTFAGVNVTPDNALQVAAVWAAVRVCVESTAVLSIDLFKRLDGGGKEVERDHPASWLLREDSNEETSAFNFRETLQGYLETWGNAYAEITFDGSGAPRALYQRNPARVQLKRRKSGKLEYEVMPADGGAPNIIPRNKMLHIPAFGGSGLVGISPVEALRETVGRNKALGIYRSASFGERMQLNGIIKHPKSLLTEGKEEIIAAMERIHKGPMHAFRTAVMDEGMEWQQIGFPNDAAQMIETGLYELQDVARAWRIPLHLLQELTHATFSNIEHQDLNFAKHTLMPRIQRWVSELDRKLLTVIERRAGLFFEINLDTLLRGDFETRQNGFSAAVGTGRMTPNEARAMENLNPIEGGDVTYVQLNWREVGKEPQEVRSVTERSLADGTKETVTEFVPIDQAGWAPGAEETTRGVTPNKSVSMLRGFNTWETGRPMFSAALMFEGRETVRELPMVSQRSAESRWRLRDIFERLLIQAGARIVTAEIKALRREIEKIPASGVAAFSLWMDGFFDRHEVFVHDVVAPVLLAMFEAMSGEALAEVGGDEEDFRADLEVFHDEYTNRFAASHVAISRGQLDKSIRENGSDIEPMLELLSGWEETRAEKLGLTTATDGMGAVSIAAYAFAGVTTKRWIWNGGDCKICPNMHGRVVEITQTFASKGEMIGDPEKVTPVEVKTTLKGPGLHRGCVCTVGPG